MKNLFATLIVALLLVGCGGSGSYTAPKSQPFTLNEWSTTNTWRNLSREEEVKATLSKSILLQTGVEDTIENIDLVGVNPVDYSQIMSAIITSANLNGYAVFKQASGGQFSRGDIIWIFVNNKYHLAVVLEAENHSDDIYQTLNIWTPDFEGGGKVIGSSDVSTTMPSVRW